MSAITGEAPPSMERSSDKRRYPRNSRKFVVKVRIVGGPMSNEVGERMAHVRNVSQGGLLISTHRPLLPETLVELKIPENALGPAKTLNGKVCWNRGDVGEYESGLAFVRITPPGAAPRAEKTAPVAASPTGERRRSPRKASRLLLKLRCVTRGLFHEELERGALLVDFSPEGVELSTSREYAPGSVLQIRFPDSPFGPTCRRHGKVIWTRPGEKDGQYLVGALFVHVAPSL